MGRRTRREFLELGTVGAAGLALGGWPGGAAAGATAQPTVFDEGRIGRLRLANRLVRASTAEGASPDGRMDDAGLAIYRGLAAGGVGLILSGHMVAVAGGDAHANQTHIHPRRGPDRVRRPGAAADPRARPAGALAGRGGRPRRGLHLVQPVPRDSRLRAHALRAAGAVTARRGKMTGRRRAIIEA